jgi:threonine dehydratase
VNKWCQAPFIHPIDLDAVRRAAGIIERVAHRTPVFRSRTLDQRCGGEVLLKAENLQRGGAFKFRGAYTALAAMDADVRAAGVVAFSSGNHAQAVAISARLWETQATIVMPADAPASKLAATRGYGAEVITYDRATEDRQAIARELAERRGLAVVPPFELPAVMAGQGTAALELIDSDGPLDVLIAPVGGGGLMAGCATAAKGLVPSIRVIGVEPSAGDDTRRSLTEGRPVEIGLPATIADGLQTTRPGDLTFEINQRLVDAVELVSDAEIVAAMVFLFERLKLVAEPSGAVGVAAVLSGRIDLAGARVGVIISGGNISAERFAQLCE